MNVQNWRKKYIYYDYGTCRETANKTKSKNRIRDRDTPNSDEINYA